MSCRAVAGLFRGLWVFCIGIQYTLLLLSQAGVTGPGIKGVERGMAPATVISSEPLKIPLLPDPSTLCCASPGDFIPEGRCSYWETENFHSTRREEGHLASLGRQAKKRVAILVRMSDPGH